MRLDAAYRLSTTMIIKNVKNWINLYLIYKEYHTSYMIKKILIFEKWKFFKDLKILTDLFNNCKNFVLCYKYSQNLSMKKLKNWHAAIIYERVHMF